MSASDVDERHLDVAEERHQRVLLELRLEDRPQAQRHVGVLARVVARAIDRASGRTGSGLSPCRRAPRTSSSVVQKLQREHIEPCATAGPDPAHSSPASCRSRPRRAECPTRRRRAGRTWRSARSSAPWGLRAARGAVASRARRAAAGSARERVCRRRSHAQQSKRPTLGRCRISALCIAVFGIRLPVGGGRTPFSPTAGGIRYLGWRPEVQLLRPDGDLDSGFEIVVLAGQTLTTLDDPGGGYQLALLAPAAQRLRCANGR